MRFDRKKVIIIHGWGSSLHEAIDQLLGLLDFRIYWKEGTFFFSNRDSLLIRKLLNTPFENKLITSCQKLLVAKMLLASTSPAETVDANSTEYKEENLIRNFGHFGIPFTFYEREYRGKTLHKRAVKELEKPLELLRKMKEELTLSNGRKLLEEEILSKYQDYSDYGELCELIEEIRNMQETGGDLDTVASAVFYTYWLTELAKAQGTSMLYGKNFEYGFVNYHEGLRHLEKHGPCDLLIADFPSGAIPDIEKDVRYLHEKDIYLERFEDHHPYTDEHVEAFENLKRDGLLGFYQLSGPREGEKEPPEEELKCGADMVYLNTIYKTAFDSEGCVELRRAAHSEDFVSGRYANGIKLTEIIKGDLCKIEIVQTLLKSLYDNKMMKHIEKRGWIKIVDEWNEYYRSIEDRLLENVYLLECERPAGERAEIGGASLGAGSDVALVQEEESARGNLKLLFALASYTEKGKPKFYVGKATEYYTKKFPGIDYLFYCYGSNLIIGRRINQADYSINLGEIMPELGDDGDGGHAGAAVGRPSCNKNYPKNLLGRVTKKNFRSFVDYMSFRFNQLGYKKIQVKDLSQNVELFSRKKGVRLLLMLLAAFMVGLLFLLVDKTYRLDNVRSSNTGFYPQIRIDE